MHLGKNFLAIIPARGGSKRLPRKNVLNLASKPLISWTIDAALNCPYLDEVMVTTDDSEIAEVAKQYGAQVPFIRPAALASDTATSFDAIKHAVVYYKQERSKEFDFVVLLQPTSPLRQAEDISAAIELLMEKNADAIISVCEADHSPLWMNTLPANRSMESFIRDEVTNVRSQDLPTYYRLNGAIYVCRTNRLLSERTFFLRNNIFAYEMEKKASIDIDNSYDLMLAQCLLRISIS